VPRRRSTPTLVPHPVTPMVDVPRIGAPTAPEREVVAAVAESQHSPALTVVRETEQNQIPVRLFDRRKTRAASHRNESDHSAVGFSNGHENGQSNDNGHANVNGRYATNGQHVPYMVDSQNGNGTHSSNGQTAGEAEVTTPQRSRKREKVGAGISSDAE
jgi:hypothetical protein